ncbi:MAG: tripartite tricarboxylate transporter TctB family protein [Mailhella sp.]|nr:tripartite tricarboxylate transporter TctB family protein [Mailhella sp.]
MYKVNILAYSFLIVFCVFAFTYIIPTWTPPYPGFGVPASYMPNALCGVICGLSVLGLLQTLIRKTGADKASGFTAKMFGQFLLLLLPIAISMPLMQKLTFIPGAVITIALLQFFAGERRWLYLSLIPVITAVIVYAGMWYGLRLPLP